MKAVSGSLQGVYTNLYDAYDENWRGVRKASTNRSLDCFMDASCDLLVSSLNRSQIFQSILPISARASSIDLHLVRGATRIASPHAYGGVTGNQLRRSHRPRNA